MGVADKETKAYMRENEIFADAFNFFLYDGAQKIQPGRLRELDTTELIQLPGTDEKQLRCTEIRGYDAGRKSLVPLAWD